MSSLAQIFDQSFQRATARRVCDADFFEAFYERFLAADPRIAEKFAHTDMAHQRSMLKKSFHYMANFYVSTELNAYLERIAERHGPHQLDITADLYDSWLEALIAVLREFDDQCTGEVELAWRVVLAPGIAYMKFANRAGQ